jgi:hypothetical protein
MHVGCSTPAGSKVLGWALGDRRFHLRLMKFLPFGEGRMVFEASVAQTSAFEVCGSSLDSRFRIQVQTGNR